jgi:uncharacterized protein YifN (PemK superfamily)
MTIPFVPLRGHILMCDFEYGKIDPEIGKVRRAVVISPRSYNHRHGYDAGRCTVIPLSATPPKEVNRAHVPFPDDAYESLTEATWALCDCLRSVSHARLNRVQIRGMNLNEIMKPEDLERVHIGLRHALGLL